MSQSPVFRIKINRILQRTAKQAINLILFVKMGVLFCRAPVLCIGSPKLFWHLF
jgi:hypothetical protein